MTEFTPENVQLRTAQRLVLRIAGDLVAERRRLARSHGGPVGGLLGAGWSGEAADQYRAACTRWRDGTDQVLTAATTAEVPDPRRRG